MKNGKAKGVAPRSKLRGYQDIFITSGQQRIRHTSTMCVRVNTMWQLLFSKLIRWNQNPLAPNFLALFERVLGTEWSSTWHLKFFTNSLSSNEIISTFLLSRFQNFLNYSHNRSKLSTKIFIKRSLTSLLSYFTNFLSSTFRANTISDCFSCCSRSSFDLWLLFRIPVIQGSGFTEHLEVEPHICSLILSIARRYTFVSIRHARMIQHASNFPCYICMFIGSTVRVCFSMDLWEDCITLAKAKQPKRK